MFDLSELKNDMLSTGELVILHPESGVETNIKITLMSPDSASYRKITMALKNKNLQLAMKNRAVVSADRLDKDALDVLVAATVSWDGIAENGVPLECTAESVRRVYEEYPFIREQVDSFLGDRKNFFKKS